MMPSAAAVLLHTHLGIGCGRRIEFCWRRTIVAAVARYKDDGADHHAAGPVRFGKLEWLWQGMAHRLDLVLDCTHENLLVFHRGRFQAGRYWLVKTASNATISFRCPVCSSTFW